MKKVLESVLAVCLLGSMLCACSQSGGGSSASSGASKADSASSVNWPAGTVNLMVPGKAGGGSDLTTRYLSTGLNKEQGINFSVYNYDNTAVCFQNIANQKPDGANLCVAHTAIMTQYITGTSEVDPAKQVTVIAAIGNNGLRCIAARKDAPYNTFKEMVDYCKTHPGIVKAGMAPGGTTQFMLGKIESECGVKFNNVQCAEETDRLTNLAGGFIDIGSISLSNGLEYEKAGKLKVLATIGTDGAKIEDFDAAAAQKQNYKSVQEQGYQNVAWGTSYYLVGPAGMSQDLVEKINASLKNIASADSEYTKGMKQMGQIAEWHDVQESQKMYQEEYDSAVKVAKDLGIYSVKQ
ncbi:MULTISPECIES: tripartite tricarboxylate transporter substrate binding protein [Acutalibacteraceae]|uniref:tripartite tricarboxylate transporter substrate binding protein n=1 Tax=Acutalibacteraceae TaxID=3082771 RepID=UPI0013E89AA5|nr:MULTISPECIES: tripartite tricarboxylate transporter substrate binding protein [Acutalibacteraceae]